MIEVNRALEALAHCGLISVAAQRARAKGSDRTSLLSDALAHYQSALELGTGDNEILSQAQYSLAVLHTNCERFDEARNLLEQAIACNPYHWRAYTALGQVEMATGHMNRAILALEKATMLSPEFEFAHFQLGRAYSASTIVNRVELALDAFSKAPGIASAHDEKGRLLAKERRDYTGAIACFERAIALNSRSADAYADLAWYLTESGLSSPEEKSKAVVAAERAVAVTERKDWHKLAVLGRVYYACREYQKAKASLIESQSLNPAAPQLYYHLACIESELGNLELAKKYLITFFSLPNQGVWKDDAASLMLSIQVQG